MFGQLGQIADLVKNAGKIREAMEQAQAQLGQVIVEGAAGGGLVTASFNGHLELQRIKINPKLLQDGDTELLEDLVNAAVNQGMAKAREAAAKSLSAVTDGIPIAGLANMFGGKGSGS